MSQRCEIMHSRQAVNGDSKQFGTYYSYCNKILERSVSF